jgi:serine/threonine-protein kinase
MLPKDIEAKYEIRGTLGSGAMGTVYDALDRMIERRVAVKVVRRPPPGDPEGEEAHARFRREAQAAGRLAHANIVGVYDYGENAETAWIVMELVEGGSLKQRLDRQERFTIPEIVRVMDEMLAALAYSHARGVVHRDIKPANVMLTAEGTVKLADFGIARLENSSMTQVGTVIGTPSYMAPEQLRGETVDARADIWAAGVMLYQLLTGEKPFDGGFSAVMHKALHTEPPPPSQLSVTAPRAFDAVVARAMAKRPEDRFPSATAFAEAIRAAAAAPAGAEPAIAGGGSLPGLDADATMVTGSIAPPRPAAPAAPPARPSPPPPPAGAAAKRGGPPIALIAGIGGGVAAAAVAGWLLLGQGGQPDPRPGDGAARQEESRRQAEQRALEEAQRIARQAAEPGAASQQAAAAEGERQQAAAAAEAERRRQQDQQAAASAEAERRRQQDQQAAAAAEAERRRQQDQQAAAAAEAERRRQQDQQAAAAAEAERRRQQDQQAAAAADAERRRQQDQQQAALGAEAERRRQQEQQEAALAAAQRYRGELRAAAAAAAIAEPCSLINWTLAEDRIVLSGLTRREGEATIRQALAARGIPPAAVQLQVQFFDGPYCQALDAIRPLIAMTPDAPPRARVLGVMPLARGELLKLTVGMPDFPAQLYVSYFMKSGEVAHLVPSRAEAAGAQVALGDPRPGFPGWEVDEPFGTDLIMVFASDRPIFPQRRPVVVSQADYLAALAARLRVLQGQNARVAARALVVETVAQR